MNGYNYNDEAFARRVEHIIDQIEMELGQAIDYVDHVMAPEVRREAGNAARLMAGHLERLADRLNPRMQPYRSTEPHRSPEPYPRQGL
jgi:hypothetical protein